MKVVDIENVTMDKELSRLATFATFPTYAVAVYPTQLAANGYFYTGSGDEIECYVCHIRINQWIDRDNPDDRHKLLSPDCAMILSITLLQRVDVLNTFSSGTSNSVLTVADSRRHVTFAAYDGNDEAAVFTQTYEYEYESDDDEDDDNSDNEFTENENEVGETTRDNHIFYHNCTEDTEEDDTDCGDEFDCALPSEMATNIILPDITRYHNATIFQATNNSGISTATASEPNMNYEGNRLATFDSWPKSDMIDPRLLAKNGFIYTGVGDTVKCVYCEGKLRAWETWSHPQREHERFYPRCPFVQGRQVGNVALTASKTTHAAAAQSIVPSPLSIVALPSSASTRSATAATTNVSALSETSAGIKLPTLFTTAHTIIDNSPSASAEVTVEKKSQRKKKKKKKNKASNADTSKVQSSNEVQLTASNANSRQSTLALEETQLNSFTPTAVVTTPSSATLQLEREGGGKGKCQRCKVREISITFMPCGHAALCVQCGQSLSNCSVCGKKAKSKFKIFLS